MLDKEICRQCLAVEVAVHHWDDADEEMWVDGRVVCPHVQLSMLTDVSMDKEFSEICPHHQEHQDKGNELADESLCKRCGRCCYAKTIIQGVRVSLDLPCPHLDEKTHLCKVYDKRHSVKPDCLSVEQSITRCVFPSDCPYVKDVEGYVGPMPLEKALKLIESVDKMEENK